MANETPKKIVDEILKSFTCSSLCSADQRIFIVGKTRYNFVESIIRNYKICAERRRQLLSLRYEQYLVCLQNIMLQEYTENHLSFLTGKANLLKIYLLELNSKGHIR